MAVLEVSDLKKSYVAPDGTTLPVIDVPSLVLNEGEQLACRVRAAVVRRLCST